MAQSNSAHDRFRSATDFPKTIQPLEPAEADALYQEMRDCLIFTNRSRSQLARRNEEHKIKTNLLKQDIGRLQIAINQLAREKQLVSQDSQSIIQSLEDEMATMATHLDELSIAFGDIADVEVEQTQWSFIALPHRFFRFLRAVKVVVTWWNSERPEDRPPLPSSSQPETVDVVDEEEDRRDRPQMYTDQASIGRSLLDR